MNAGMICLALALMPMAEPDETKNMAGVWKVVAIFEEGVGLSEKEIASELFAEGKITIDGPVISFLPPGSFERKSVAFVLNTTVEPKQISLVGATKVGAKGIYMQTGDSLMVCIAGLGEKEAPKEFSTPKNSGRILMTFKRTKDEVVPFRPAPVAVESKKETDPLITVIPFKVNDVKVPMAPLEPPPVAPKEQDNLRKMLIGTWGHQTDDTVTYVTFNPDGSFSMSTKWKRSIKTVFSDDIHTSGEWKVEDGVLIAKVAVSTNKDLRGQVHSYRIVRIDDKDLIAIDGQGKSRREWKVR